MITFDTDPSRHRHWRLACDGPIATLTLDVAEEGWACARLSAEAQFLRSRRDIELHDALNRVLFEHPEVPADIAVLDRINVFAVERGQRVNVGLGRSVRLHGTLSKTACEIVIGAAA